MVKNRLSTLINSNRHCVVTTNTTHSPMTTYGDNNDRRRLSWKGVVTTTTTLTTKSTSSLNQEHLRWYCYYLSANAKRRIHIPHSLAANYWRVPTLSINSCTVQHFHPKKKKTRPIAWSRLHYVICDPRTDRLTNQPTKRLIESRARNLKKWRILCGRRDLIGIVCHLQTINAWYSKLVNVLTVWD